MIERATRFGNLVFDRDAIVRAALRAYVEAVLHGLARFSFPACAVPRWTGDLQRGAFCNDDGCGSYEVVAWTEAGIVGLAYELGFGPIEHLDLPIDAVTGGPDDVRGALPGLPNELTPALILATSMLGEGPNHGEKSAGVGFWLHDDHVAGTLFDDPINVGGSRLAAWGLLRGGRLLPLSSTASSYPRPGGIVMELDRPQDAPAHALMDRMVDRRLRGPTELMIDEIETLFPNAQRPLGIQRMLQKVGITWPGSPEIPEQPPWTGPDPFRRGTVTTLVESRRFLNFDFDRDTIVRVALRTYVEAVFVEADSFRRHDVPPCVDPRWTGDLNRGAFYHGDKDGAYDIVAWTEEGVVGLAYEPGFGPIEHLDLSVDAVTRGPNDVRGALTLLPPELESALVMAAGMLGEGAMHGEKLAGIGFWLHGEHVGGSLFNHRSSAGNRRLLAWGLLRQGRLLMVGADVSTIALNVARRARLPEPPIRAMVDVVVARALAGPTELTTDELATLLPSPPDPERLLSAQRLLQKVGITWPGSPELPPETPREKGRNPSLPPDLPK